MKEEIMSKMQDMLTKMWASPETMSKLKDEVSSWKNTAVVAVSVKKEDSLEDDSWENKKELCDMSPEEIDKMPESNLKTLVKEYISKKQEKKSSFSDRIMNAPTM